MGRINDVGGMAGYGPVEVGDDAEPFQADWEARVFGLNSALIGRGLYTLDEFRDTIETMPPEAYAAASYYERWFHAIRTLLRRKGVLDE